MKNFTARFNFAKTNGYKGTEREYIQNQYAGYATICKRCDIEPMTYESWLANA